MNNRTFYLVVTAIALTLMIALIALIDGLAASAPSTFERRDAIVQECLQSDRYSREECILLAGDK